MTDKIIGTGGDYTTINSWEADMPDLSGTSQTWRGLCKNQAFNGGDGSGAAIVISGGNPSSSFYAELTTDTGASFVDHANKLTNALKYNESNGAAIYTASNYTVLLTNSQNYTRINKLQLTTKSGANRQALLSSSNHVVVKRCIIEYTVAYSSVCTITDAGIAGSMVVNCLLVARANVQCASFSYPSNDARYVNCTIVAPSDVTTTGKYGSTTNRGANSIVKNCAIFQFAAGAIHTTYQSWDAATDYIATDAASVEGSGTHNLTSLTYANQFENVVDSTRDFRAVSGGSLDGAGLTDSDADGIDIVGQTRANPPTIGCWEVVAAAPTETMGLVKQRTYRPAPFAPGIAR